MQDVLHTVSQPLPHDAFLPLSHATDPNSGAQHHFLPGLGAGPPLRFPLGELISAAGPAGSNHPPPAYDRATPPADDRLVNPPLSEAAYGGRAQRGASFRHHALVHSNRIETVSALRVVFGRG